MFSSRRFTLTVATATTALAALSVGATAVAAERQVSRAGIEYVPTKFESLSEAAAMTAVTWPRSDRSAATTPTVSRAGPEYQPRVYSGRADFATANFDGGNPKPTSLGINGVQTRAGLEYEPPSFQNLREVFGQSSAPVAAVPHTERFEPPYANRAGIDKTPVRYDSFAEFRARMRAETANN